MQPSRRVVLLGALTLSFVSRQSLAQGDFLKQGLDLLGGKKGSGGAGAGAALSDAEIGEGLKEALKVGSDRVVATLGAADGFNANPEVHIPLPDTLKTVQSALSKVGMSDMADELELRLNRGAEAAVPRAKELFWDSIAALTLDDVRRIYEGPDDAATQYFRGKMSKPLASEMRPIVDEELAQAGAVKSYDQMMGQYAKLPLVPDAKANLTEHVLEKAIGAVFLLLGREEAAIRQDPAKRSTELLQKVFGAA